MLHARAYSGQYFLGRGRAFNISTVVPTADMLYAVPFDQIMLIDMIFINNKGGGSNGPLARLGLYDGTGTGGLPGTLIEGSDELGMSEGQNGHREFHLTTEYELTGKEWVAAVFAGDPCAGISGCSISLTAQSSMEAFGGFGIETPWSPRNAVSASHTFGAMPSTFPTASPANTSMGLFVRGA